MSDDATDRAWMARAVALAERGRGTVRPNPPVGCVLVRDGEVVGEGYHERPGGPHAEVVALSAAGERAAGATAFVTLEPCDHTGRTGPCTVALIDAGVRRVVYAVPDPNPVAAGGRDRLAGAGIEVQAGVLAEWAERQNVRFLSLVRERRPYLTLKLAQTWDGALSVPGRRWVTGAAARAEVHRLRADADAVLVGVGTVLADDPRLDVRHVPLPPDAQPRPVVLDTAGRTPPTAAVVRPGAVVVAGAAADGDWETAVTSAGAEVVRVPTGADGRADLDRAMTALRELGIEVVLAEPGPTLATALVAAEAVDRLVLHVSPDGRGDADAAPTLTPSVVPPATAGWSWEHLASGRLGDDRELVALPTPATATVTVEARRSA